MQICVAIGIIHTIATGTCIRMMYTVLITQKTKLLQRLTETLILQQLEKFFPYRQCPVIGRGRYTH